MILCTWTLRMKPMRFVLSLKGVWSKIFHYWITGLIDFSINYYITSGWNKGTISEHMEQSRFEQRKEQNKSELIFKYTGHKNARRDLGKKGSPNFAHDLEQSQNSPLSGTWETKNFSHYRQITSYHNGKRTHKRRYVTKIELRKTLISNYSAKKRHPVHKVRSL